MQDDYHSVYGAWKDDPETFWARAAKAIDWFEPSGRIFDTAAGVYGRWFPDGKTNTCYNCVDRHVEAGHGHVEALLYDSTLTGRKARFTYAELLANINAMASILVDHGVEQGDRVILYMPMVPEAIFAMLACARIGAVHSVVFGGFAASELAARIDDSKAKVVVTASCGLEPSRIIAYKPLLDAAISMARHRPSRCLVLQRPELVADLDDSRDVDLGPALDLALTAGRTAPCASLPATHPLYILYTSGTTGKPKGVIRDTGGHMVALAWTMRAIYGVGPGEVYWAASDIGWVVGHSYIVYAPLLNGSTTVLYEGKPVGTPDAGAFWRVVEDYGVTVLFTAPTALRAIRKEDPDAALVSRCDLGTLRALFLAGERADPETVRWAEETLGVPVIDHWWQTETGWAIVANPLGLGALSVKRGSPTVPMPGYALDVLDDDGHLLPAGVLGNIAIRLPLPPGCLPTFWNADERFRETCLSDFPGYYKTADAGYVDEDGYVFIMSRTDDIINVAGHRLSTGAIEEVCAAHPDVAECAVIGVADALKGQVPNGFLVLKSGVSRESSIIEKEVVALVRDRIGPVASFKTAMCVKRLPKTRSGKILRGTMQKIADGEPWTVPATIDDPAILTEIGNVIAARPKA